MRVVISYKASDAKPEQRSFEDKNRQLTSQTFLKILMKQFCFLHKLKAFPLSTNNMFIYKSQKDTYSATTVCYRMHSEILFPEDDG